MQAPRTLGVAPGVHPKVLPDCNFKVAERKVMKRIRRNHFNSL